MERVIIYKFSNYFKAYKVTYFDDNVILIWNKARFSLNITYKYDILQYIL